MGFLSRRRDESRAESTVQLAEDTTSLRVREIEHRLRQLELRLEALEEALKDAPSGSDFRLLASELARLSAEMERMDAKHREGILALYTQVHKELRSIRGDRVIQMIDVEPVSKEKLGKASDQLSELARTWRKRRAQPAAGKD